MTNEISGLRTDVISEPGDNPTFILFKKPVPDGQDAYQVPYRQESASRMISARRICRLKIA